MAQKVYRIEWNIRQETYIVASNVEEAEEIFSIELDVQKDGNYIEASTDIIEVSECKKRDIPKDQKVHISKAQKEAKDG